MTAASVNDKERKAIVLLEKLAKQWPESLTLFSRSGNLCVLKFGGGRTVRQATVAESIPIPNGGGDPDENDVFES